MDAGIARRYQWRSPLLKYVGAFFLSRQSTRFSNLSNLLRNFDTNLFLKKY
jgi:hypothetical protein